MGGGGRRRHATEPAACPCACLRCLVFMTANCLARMHIPGRGPALRHRRWLDHRHDAVDRGHTVHGTAQHRPGASLRRAYMDRRCTPGPAPSPSSLPLPPPAPTSPSPQPPPSRRAARWLARGTHSRALAWTTQINQRAVGIPMPEPEPEPPSSSAQPAGVAPEKLRTVSVQCVSVMSSAAACLSAADGSASESDESWAD
eukprot:COSAG01_NODE_1031_length_12014_cov_27.936131_12_plen_200_part_00